MPAPPRQHAGTSQEPIAGVRRTENGKGKPPSRISIGGRNEDHGRLYSHGRGHAGVMRRNDKQVSDPTVIEKLLSAGRVCRIGMVDGDEPYIVPVNYGYEDNSLYIHSAAAGRKIEILERDRRVCFEIESPVEITAHAEPCHWGAKARSLVGYGIVEIVTDLQGKKHGLDVIMRHYGKRDANAYSQTQLEAVVVLKVAIESVGCKQVGEWE